MFFEVLSLLIQGLQGPVKAHTVHLVVLSLSLNIEQFPCLLFCLLFMTLTYSEHSGCYLVESSPFRICPIASS